MYCVPSCGVGCLSRIEPVEAENFLPLGVLLMQGGIAGEIGRILLSILLRL